MAEAVLDSRESTGDAMCGDDIVSSIDIRFSVVAGIHLILIAGDS